VSVVKLILRSKEFEVKPGMTLLSALQKIEVLPESVIATREGEMILEDEILRDGDVVKLIAVISGGSCHCEERSLRRSNPLFNWEIASGGRAPSSQHLHRTQVPV
jgi:sulfur carrier protein